MLLSNLIASSEGLTLHGSDVDIVGISADSRQIAPGFLFVAIPGTRHDGRSYISEALARGAVAILAPREPALPPFPHVSLITAPDIRLAVSGIAAKFYPQAPATIVAVTGTSGKTSTAQFTREIWQVLGFSSASIGTLGIVTKDETRYGGLTTPDAITLHEQIDACARAGVTHLAMEASSHGLALHRLDHVRIKAGGFTNLTHDHLDFHETMEAYLNAKLRLFTEVMAPGATAVLNADIPAYEAITISALARGLRVISYGQKARDIKLIETKPDAAGQVLRFEFLGKTRTLLLPIMGGFQASNSLCALGLVTATGADPERAIDALQGLTGVAGRLQLVGRAATGGAVFVDYAHKPDALENVLKALRPHVAAHQGARLGVIFGCGGNRDKFKRPLMGEIACRLADWVIVTDDNPRHEEPQVIRREILAGCPKTADVSEIGDRAHAITDGLARLGEHDVLIIAGKGHESGQIIGDTTLPFDDALMARKVLGL